MANLYSFGMINTVCTDLGGASHDWLEVPELRHRLASRFGEVERLNEDVCAVAVLEGDAQEEVARDVQMLVWQFIRKTSFKERLLTRFVLTEMQSKSSLSKSNGRLLLDPTRVTLSGFSTLFGISLTAGAPCTLSDVDEDL